jgi:hypothetical protein
MVNDTVLVAWCQVLGQYAAPGQVLVGDTRVMQMAESSTGLRQLDRWLLDKQAVSRFVSAKLRETEPVHVHRPFSRRIVQ